MKDKKKGQRCYWRTGSNWIAGLSQICTCLLSNSSKHKKAKSAYKKVVAKISHNEYEDALLNKKCLRYSMNRIPSKNHKIGTYDINKISMSCFIEKEDLMEWKCTGNKFQVLSKICFGYWISHKIYLFGKWGFAIYPLFIW